MRRFVIFVFIFLIGAATAFGQLYDYSIIGQQTKDFWDGTGDSEFSVRTATTGIQFGQMQERGFGTEWAANILVPLSLTFDGADGVQKATFADANFGFGLAFRYGVGFGLNPIERLLITPGIAWHAMLTSYSFDFPGGAPEYRELTTGPAAVGQVAYRLVDNIWLQGGVFFGFSPFHFGNISISGTDEDMMYGFVTRGWLGARLPFSPPGGLF